MITVVPEGLTFYWKYSGKLECKRFALFHDHSLNLVPLLLEEKQVGQILRF
jgi:hypothetical protein